MSQSSGRRFEIARVILAVWDSRKAAYIENVSDSYVAMTYGFSVEEVESVREELFEKAREKAKEMKKERSELARHLAKTRECYDDLIRVWGCFEKMSRLSPRLTYSISKLINEIEKFHEEADGTLMSPDPHKIIQAAAKSAQYFNQYKGEIQQFNISMNKVEEIFRRLGFEVMLQPSILAMDDFTSSAVKSMLPLIAKSARRQFKDDPDFEDPHA